jgi:hypothetical protein
MPLRVAVTGAGQSPALDVTVHAIGKSRSVERINKALALLLNAKASNPDSDVEDNETAGISCRFFLFLTGNAETDKKTADPFTGQKVPQVLLLFWRHQMQRFGNLPPDSAASLTK